GEGLARAPADLGALVEDGEKARGRRRAELGGMAGEPEAARALEAGDVLRLAQRLRHQCTVTSPAAGGNASEAAGVGSPPSVCSQPIRPPSRRTATPACGSGS